MSDYKAFRVDLADKIAHVQINRPEKVNAMNADFWREIIEIFRWVDATDAVRVVVLSGAGKHFSSGIDLMLLASVGAQLEALAQSSDPLVRDRAEGWARLRKQDGMHEHVRIAPITARILDAMAGPPDHPLHDRKALMVLYSSPDADARDEAQQEVQRRSAEMFPILAERSVALNEVAQEAGYSDFVHAQTDLAVGEARVPREPLEAGHLGGARLRRAGGRRHWRGQAVSLEMWHG